jgi:hypothetical protein
MTHDSEERCHDEDECTPDDIHPLWMLFHCFLSWTDPVDLSSKKEVPPGSEDPRGTTLFAE